MAAKANKNIRPADWQLSISQLAALQGVAELAPAALAKKDPALFRLVEAPLAARRRAVVLEALSNGPADLRAALGRIYLSGLPASGESFVNEILAALKHAKASKALLTTATTLLNAAAAAGRLIDPASSGAPLQNDPVTRPVILSAQLAAVLAGAGLQEAKVSSAVAGIGNISLLSRDKLDALVSASKLTALEADRAEVAAVVFQLSDGSTAASQAIFGLRRNNSAIPIRQTRDLVALESGDWLSVIAAAKLTAPAGMTPQDLAQLLTERVARLVPADFLLRRAVVIPGDLTELVRADAPVRSGGPLTPLQQLVRRNPGLRLDEVLSERGEYDSPEAKSQEVTRRIQLLVDTSNRNVDKNLLALDYSPDSPDAANIVTSPLATKADHDLVVSNLRAQQRALIVGGDAATALRLLDRGFTGARSIVAQPLERFMSTSGLESRRARMVYGRAQEGATAAAAKAMAVVSGSKKQLKGTGSSNDIGPVLAKIPGYADLFGSLGFCDCEECQSVLGLAAYFVDLMFFVQKYITNVPENFATVPDHPLNLNSRRPDLWTLQLSCDNATQVIPYLDIVNGVLEGYLVTKVPAAAGDVWSVISAKNWSFFQPFCWPLALSHFSKLRLDAAIACGAGPDVITRATLRVSEVEHGMILSPIAANPANPTSAEQTALETLYRSKIDVAGNGTVSANGLNIVYVGDMLEATGATRVQLTDLLASQFIRNGADLHTEAGRSSAQSVQNDVEVIKGLTADNLDRLHRFYRLSRQLPWTIPELDLVLTWLRSNGLSTGIDTPALSAIARLATMKERLNVSVQELCGLWAEIPNVSLNEQPGLFDVMFNPPQLASLGTPLVYTDNAAPTFLHPSWNTNAAGGANPGTSSPRDNTLARLLAGLCVSDKDFVQLLTNLATPLGINLGGSPAQHGFALSISNLSLLYRHAMLSRALGLAVPELFQLIALADIGADILKAPPVPPLAPGAAAIVHVMETISALLDARDWLSASGFTHDEAAFISGKSILDETQLPDAQALVASAMSQLLKDRAFEFGDTILSGLPNGAQTLTEEQSRVIIQANAVLFETPPGTSKLRLKATVVPEPAAPDIQVPNDPTIVATAASIAAKLAEHSIYELILDALNNALGLSPEKAQEIYRLSGQAQTLASARFLQAMAAVLYAGGNDQSAFIPVVRGVLLYTVLYRDEAYDAATIDFIRQRRDAFGVAAGPSLTAVRLSARFQQFAAPPEPAFVAADTQMPDPVALRAVVAIAGGVVNASTDNIAKALRTDKARIDALLPHIGQQLAAAGGNLDQLVRIAACLDLMSLLGINGETLTDLALPSTSIPPEAEYPRLRRAADGVFAAFRAKYVADADFQAKVEPYEDKLRSRQRDGLAAYLCFSEPARFSTTDDLYPYFLLDVKLEGCARTTRVAAAVFSLQLYIHRVLLHLEQAVAPPVTVTSSYIPRDEWSWIRRFRVWQANRKVFLYPENYLEPDLRDDKTPLFKGLEDTLLQQAITEQNVRDAYSKYLSEFVKISQLRIVAACSQSTQPDPTDPNSRSDILHMIGATSSDPPQFYYRAIMNIQEAAQTADVNFGSWTPIDLQIAARSCSAIVYLGTVYVFWVEVTTLPKSVLTGGASMFLGYKHKVTFKFSSLRLDGRWSAPQLLRLKIGRGLADFWTVDDPLSPASYLFTAGNPSPIDIVFPADTNGNVPPPVKRGDPLPSDMDLVVPLVPRYDEPNKHTEPQDDYTLHGYQWEAPYPAVVGDTLVIKYGVYGVWTFEVDLLNLVVTEVQSSGQTSWQPAMALLMDQSNAVRGLANGSFWGPWPQDPYQTSATLFNDGAVDVLDTPLIAPGASPFELTPIADSPNSAILRVDNQHYYVNGVAPWVVLLNSALAPDLAKTLFTGGIESLLSLTTQMPMNQQQGQRAPMQESVPDFALNGPPAIPTDIDYRGAAGCYYNEIFAHIPWRIADHLRAAGQYESAQRWYELIFDPAGENDPPAHPPERRVWQFARYRTDTYQTMRDFLDNAAQLGVYRRDPFSPHAIARLRPGAYEKAMVAQYVGNLLEWGDTLFLQFTSESINEATMLYILASDILGDRPIDVGSCGEKMSRGGAPITYAIVEPLLNAGHEFLLELENVWTYTIPGWGVHLSTDNIKRAQRIALSYSSASVAAVSDASESALSQPLGWQGVPPVMWQQAGGTPLSLMQLGSRLAPATAAKGTLFGVSPDPFGPPDTAPPVVGGGLQRGGYVSVGNRGYGGGIFTNPPFNQHTPNVQPWQVLDTALVFCIPDNLELLELWNRVETRLYNIRHCLDINGVSRTPDLFGPPIDPHLLAQIEAEGLTLEEVLNVTSGKVPPYRFSTLLSKAREYTATVQGFGSALQSALEKRDNTSLEQLRSVHEQHLLKMRTQVLNYEISSAQQMLKSLQSQQDAAQYRHDYYRGLSQSGLTSWETTQQVSTHLGNASLEASAILELVAGGLALLPQLGAPTAMKYGGTELNMSAARFAGALKLIGDASALLSHSAGLEATFRRRDDEWRHQAELAQREIEQIARQISAANFRVQIGQAELEAHNKNIDQTEEIYQFYQDRFTNLGLYKVLATSLQTLYRSAFNSAFAMASLADQAYRFERPDDAGLHLTGNYWDASTGGLLAGERLMLDLQALERAHLETDRRQLEIEQSFSLAQFNPSALLTLREAGECQFSVPETFFDLSYPGHYRRRIKSVRLTIPCIVGPYTNAGATLRLQTSTIRMNPTSQPTVVAPRHEVSIAASSAQNDAGVFELSFRDERYVPFEGNGAVSSWLLTLPKSFRVFDYESISDVVLRISYTALSDDNLRAMVEGQLADVTRSVATQLAGMDLQSVVSLRHDLPDVFARLARTPAGTNLPFTIDAQRLPWFLNKRGTTLTSLHVILRTESRTQLPTMTLSLDGGPVGAFAADARGMVSGNAAVRRYNLFASGDLGPALASWFDQAHTIALTSVGNLKPNPANATNAIVDTSQLLDILFEARYRLAGA